MFCRAADEHVRKAGGWNKQTAMEQFYISSASPAATCAVAGFKGITDYCPAHKYAEPSDVLIRLVFGNVLIKPNADTGEEHALNIDEAIQVCRQHHNDTHGKGVSAVPLFEFMRLIAKTLLQARILFDRPSCCYAQ